MISREELLELRRQDILDAARRIFATQGYEPSNVEDIAREAGIAKGTVYLYFKSKEEVFAAVLGSDLESLTNQTVEAMSKEKFIAEKLRVFLQLRGDFVQNKQDFLRIYLAESGSRGSRSPVIAEAIDKPFWRGVEFMRECIAKAVDAAEINPVPVEPAAFAVLDLARGFAERRLRGWSTLTIEEDLEFTYSMILQGLRGL